ncbi:inhibitor of growth protein 3 [Microdochium nivale]|nr:inhibitor of growth protein 3 [Microdochium nivale]
MKTAKLPTQQADSTGSASSSRRAQPARQARTNPPRTLSGLANSSHESRRAPPAHDQPIDIFPALTHFTDAIQSLPKDLVRHFTLLKEVDAKIFAPEETLFQLVDAALKSIPPDVRRTTTGSSIVGTTTPVSTAQHSVAASMDEGFNQAVFDPNNIPRRQLFHHTAYKIQEMLNSLEEKNHVISTANDALSKQLSRISDVWPHLEGEFSDEAKWGSINHWAYPSNRENNRVSQAERSRRDGAATITAAAQQLAEEAAARSDARKQAVAAKKSLKAQQQLRHESDADEQETTSKSKADGKKTVVNKSRKVADAAAATASVGSVTSAPAGVSVNPAPKKRKAEKPPVNGGQAMERSLSSVFGDKSAKATKNLSPRGTPGPDQPAKKRKALPTANSAAKKSKTAPTVPATTSVVPSAASPALAAVMSPALPSFLDAKATPGKSPVPPPAALARPSSSRARANSVRSIAEPSVQQQLLQQQQQQQQQPQSQPQQRPPSSASNKANGATIPAPISTTPVPPPLLNGGRPPIMEAKPVKEAAPPIKTEASKDEVAKPSSRASSTADSSKKDSMPKAEEPEPVRAEAAQQTPQTTAAFVVTTKSGRASKPSTPALGSFPDPVPIPRSRTSRNQAAAAATTTTTTTTTTAIAAKRSHKKGASQMAALAQAADDDAASSSVPDDDEDADIDADEPLYCYCNNVSYGEMVACDAEGCEKEWFHLGCVGLKAAPGPNTTWYCDNCKDRQKHGKKPSGR